MFCTLSNMTASHRFIRAILFKTILDARKIKSKRKNKIQAHKTKQTNKKRENIKTSDPSLKCRTR